jgi:hypothetical protein
MWLEDQNLNEIFFSEGWQIAKAKRMAISKESSKKTTIAGERLMIDIRCAHQSDWNWTGEYYLLVANEATSMKLLFFLAKKSI